MGSVVISSVVGSVISSVMSSVMSSVVNSVMGSNYSEDEVIEGGSESADGSRIKGVNRR